jgi:photosystem II stability/assembly factor-like uncharacterized protein
MNRTLDVFRPRGYDSSVVKIKNLKGEEGMRKVLSVFIAACLVLSLFTGVFVSMPSARADTSGDYQYTLAGGNATITHYTGGNGVVIIPSTLGGCPVGTIDGAFAYCSFLIKVTIPNSVTSIGGLAFCGCRLLTKVTIPNSVKTIGFDAFEDCTALTSVIIPNSVTSIGEMAFKGCSSLASLIIGRGMATIPAITFENCTALTSLTIPNSARSIGDRAFSGCTSLTKVTIPNSVKTIGSGAFSGCTSLTKVTIPNSVRSIGAIAFYDCRSLNTVYFLGNAPTGSSDLFVGCAAGFSVHYVTGTTGWSNPWYGYRTTAVTPSQQTATLTVTSTPKGAEVFLDGASLGVTPIQGHHIGAGSHTILLKKQGYKDVTEAVDLSKQETSKTLSYQLTASSSTTPSAPAIPVSISSNPPGAKVSIDGVSKGGTPLIVSLKPGTYSIGITKDGYNTYQGTLEIKTTDKAKVVPVTLAKSGKKVPMTLPKNLSQIAWMDSGTGWGWAWSTNGHILQTLNGGASWKEAPTPDMAGRSIVAASFPNGSTAFLATRAGGADLHSDIVVYRTSDKGSTWNSTSVVMKLGYEGEDYGGFLMEFPDASHGFLMGASGDSCGLMMKALYKTVDSGKNFSLVGDITTEVAGDVTGMKFLSRQIGFVTCSNHGLDYIPVYMTVDGGTTWHRVSLPIPTACKGYYMDAYPPVFFGQQTKNGIFAMHFMMDGKSVMQLYRTSNGGSTWTLGPVSKQAVIPSYFSNYTTGWGVTEIGGGMFKTVDGGATWAPVTMAN